MAPTSKSLEENKLKILMLLVIFICLGALFIISNENLHLNNTEEREVFLKSYNDWFSNLFENTKNVTGYVLKSEWLPKHTSKK